VLKQDVQKHGISSSTYIPFPAESKSDVYRSSEKKGDNMMILKPSMGVITIERTFKNISTTDYVWGFYVVSRMARTSFLDSKVTIRCTVTTTRSEALFDNKYAKVLMPERSISMRCCILEENAEQLMPRVNTAYVLRLGEVIPLKAGEMYNVCVKLEVECDNIALNTGLVGPDKSQLIVDLVLGQIGECVFAANNSTISIY